MIKSEEGGAVTTDRGRQFESQLWQEVSNLLGTTSLDCL